MSGQDRPALRRRSRRLASVIPASEWIGLGYDPEAAQALESLQREIQKNCQGDASASDNSAAVYLKGNGNCLRHEDVSCNDLMLPHWMKLAKRLKQVDKFTVHGINLSLSVWDTLFSSVSTSVRLRKLCLTFVRLGRDGYHRLSSFLEENTSLVDLRLGGEMIPDPDVAGALSDAMRSQSTLEHCCFIHCGQSDTRILRRILPGCEGLKSLGFAMEGLGPGGVAAIAEFIGSNCRLDVLELQQNNLWDEDALVFAQSVKRNEHLRLLDLSGNEGYFSNNITDAGREALMDIMFDTSSMKSIVESLHSCMIITRETEGEGANATYADMTPLETDIAFINSEEISVEKKIRKKVVLALCGGVGGSFDVKHFDGVSLKLMPRCLELIQAHCEYLLRLGEFPSNLESYALSRVFQVMRAWEMPSLYENLSASSAEAGRKRKRRNISH